jgi:uncharacterized protein (DUF2384 family)
MPRSTRPSSSKFRARLAPKRTKKERKKEEFHIVISQQRRAKRHPQILKYIK